MDAFQFIKDVAMDWATYIFRSRTREFITEARKAKGTNNWFVGAITNENSRTATVDLSFLDPGKKYLAMIYADAADAHYEKSYCLYNHTTNS
jgi:hypothetical protein